MFAHWQEELGRVGELVSGIDPEVLVGDQPAVLVEQVASLEKRLGRLRGRLARRAVTQRGEPWKAKGYGSATEWLARTTGTSPKQAEQSLDTARQLEGLPVAGEAYRDGRLSEGQAGEVARAARVAPEAEDQLVRTATEGSLRQLREHAKRVEAAHSDQARVYRRQVRNRRLRAFTDRDGLGHLDVALPPDRYAAAKAVLDAECDRVFAAARHTGRREKPQAYGADAAFNLICGQTPGALHPDPTGAKPGQPSYQPPTANQHPNAPIDQAPEHTTAEAASDDCAASGGTAGVDGVPSRRLKAAAEIVFQVDLAAYRRGRVLSGETCEIRNVGPVPVEVVAGWLDDAFVKTVIRDGTRIATVCHHGRHIPETLKTALAIRDPVCAVPGCDRRIRLERDHQIPYAQGGPTSAANLRQVCKPLHHDQITYHGYRLEGPPGARRWLDPHGTLITADPPPPDDPPPIAHRLPPELRPHADPPLQLPLE